MESICGGKHIFLSQICLLTPAAQFPSLHFTYVYRMWCFWHFGGESRRPQTPPRPIRGSLDRSTWGLTSRRLSLTVIWPRWRWHESVHRSSDRRASHSSTIHCREVILPTAHVWEICAKSFLWQQASGFYQEESSTSPATSLGLGVNIFHYPLFILIAFH